MTNNRGISSPSFNTLVDHQAGDSSSQCFCNYIITLSSVAWHRMENKATWHFWLPPNSIADICQRIILILISFHLPLNWACLAAKQLSTLGAKERTKNGNELTDIGLMRSIYFPVHRWTESAWIHGHLIGSENIRWDIQITTGTVTDCCNCWWGIGLI